MPQLSLFFHIRQSIFQTVADPCIRCSVHIFAYPAHNFIMAPLLPKPFPGRF